MLLDSVRFDVLGVTESTLTSKNCDSDIDIPGYKFLRKDRVTEDGGWGCILYFAESLDVTEAFHLFPSEWNKLEAIWAEINLHSQKLLISVVYRPPMDTNFYVTLERQLENIWIKRKNIFIMGDLNSDLLKKRGDGKAVSETGTKLLNVINKFGLALLSHTRQHIREKTDQLGMIECSIAPGVLDPPPPPFPGRLFFW